MTASAEGFDAVVVGGGPNGLAAAIEIARAGRSVVVYEAADRPGGGCRSAELTLPGFVHDVCSAIHPLAVASPFLKSVPLERLGARVLHPKIPLAQPLDGGRAAFLRRSVDETAAAFGPDERAYRRLMGPLVRNADSLIEELLGPLGIPRHPLAMARFGLNGLWPAATLLSRRFEGDAPKALLGGAAAHAMLPLDRSPTAAVGLLLGLLAHAVGWPVIEGGSQRLTDALVAYLAELGGEVRNGETVTSLKQLQESRCVLFDVSPRQMLQIASDELPSRYAGRLSKFRHGPGIFKIDWALDGPVPWANPECGDAGTVHLGGTLEEMAASERASWEGRIPEHPYVLLGQQSACDPSRAPEGKHTLWGYCHVPSGSNIDMTDRIEAQLERFAPGFKDRVLARSTMAPKEVEDYNANYIGGDITGGVQDLRQTFARPAARLDPYTTPNERLFICSASAPPGGGVHGMAGYHAARSALRRVLA
ncbi:MAG TPA: NAD(P)/FAD-dependent oxidoreductase [Actinomycetota bacterium]|nr:NAD(P)/FAD-dependent oxidoreductase [Actinomycetota bacterium]